MKKFSLVLILFLALTSCRNKTLQLPQVGVAGQSEIQNYSQIWVFYKEKDNEVKADLNRNNTIGTTHWVINIDKRLPLSEVVPAFHYIKNKRSGKSIHSVEGMQNYFSYSDTKNEKIALFPIDSINFLVQTKDELAKLEQEDMCDYIIEFSNNAIWLNEHRIPTESWESLELDSLSQGKIQLHFDENLSYQDYLYYRLTLNEKLSTGVSLEKTEFVIH